jgi:anti-sigma regulatory factor (Ser/Thr protein kinase)
MSHRPSLFEATTWITEAALQHPDDLVPHVAHRLGTHRRLARALLRQLVAAQWLHCSGPKPLVRYRPGDFRQVIRRYALAGLHEDQPWTQDIAPCLALPEQVARMARWALAELLGNAVAHSGGRAVTVSVRQTPLQLQMLVSDDGQGIFDKLALSHHEPDPVQGLLSSRGGLQGTALLADVMDVHANQVGLQQCDWDRGHWAPRRPVSARGTAVYVAICLDTGRTLESVLQAAAQANQVWADALPMARLPERGLVAVTQATQA